jgi:general stress protein YciG
MIVGLRLGNRQSNRICNIGVADTQPDRNKTIQMEMKKMAEERRERKGEMTVSEAGRMGGEKTAETHGREFYEEIGHKGGQRVKELIEEGKQAEGSSSQSRRSSMSSERSR